MALITNLGQLESRIARELRRDDLGLEIREALEGAIEDLSDEPLWFLEYVSTGLVTVAGTASYALDADLIEIDEVTLTSSSDSYPLEWVDWSDYRWLQTNETDLQGQPWKYSLFDEKIWLYPTPGEVYDYTIYGRERLPALTEPNDTNAWITSAWQLLLARACHQVGGDLPPDRIAKYMAAEREHLNRLLRKSRNRTTGGRIVPRCF